MAILKVTPNPPTTVKGLKGLLSYVLRDEKTDERLIDGVGDFHDYEYGYEYDRDRVYAEFRRAQTEFNKLTGRLCAHYIMSFAPGEIQADQAHSIGIELAERLWPDRQVLVVTHTDKEHIHNHFIINSTSFADGRKLHTAQKDLEEYRRVCDDLCRSYHLSVPEKGKHADGSDIRPGELTTGSKALWNLVKDGKGCYIADCASCVQDVLQSSTSQTDFVMQMQQHGWAVRWTDDRKHITFVDTDGHRVRDSKISKSFNMTISKDDLLEIFRQNEKTLAVRAEQEERGRHRRHL